MPPKKKLNGFLLFMLETRENLASKGIKMNMSEMPNFCQKDWDNMSDEMKGQYKEKSKNMKFESKIQKYTSVGEKVEDIEKQSETYKSQTNAMYLYIEELVRMEPIKCYLPKNKFILIHVNAYTCEKEQFYFPAEISMAEFSLEKGLIRVFHRLIGFDKIRTNAPLAPTADINSHAKNNHQIGSFSKLSNNYKEVLLSVIGFIVNKKVDEAVLNDPSLDMPPIYTAHNSTTKEIMITNSSLHQLYKSVIKNANRDEFNDLFKVFHLDKLFMELKNVSYKSRFPHIDEKALPSIALATEALTKDMFNIMLSVGCSFHEKLEQAHVCSNYLICKWIYILSVHCCQYFNIKPVSGCHYDFDLSKSKIPVEEHFESLNVYKNDQFTHLNLQKKSKNLSGDSFPALEGGLSTTVQKPIWNVPEHKVNTHSNTTTYKSDNFPPLGNAQKAIPQNIPSVSRWHNNNTVCGSGIMGKVQNNDEDQTYENTKKKI